MRLTNCRWCGKPMVVKPRILDKNDIYLQLFYNARFTGKFYHDDCFFSMMRQEYNVVNPEEL